MTFRPSSKAQQKKILRLAITEVVKGGDGLARTTLGGEPRTVLVPLTAPGDEIEAEVTVRGAVLRGELLTVLRPGEQRVSPVCPYFERCGGCDLMHLSTRAQREYRERTVRAALRKAVGEHQEVVMHDAPEALGYRRRARLFLESTSKGSVCGFRAASSHRIVEVQSCQVLEARIDQARAQLAQWISGSTGRGEALLQPGLDGKVAVNLRWFGGLAPRVFAQAEKMVADGQWAGVSILLEGAGSPAVIGDPRGYALAVDDLPLETSSGGFMQAYAAMNRELVQAVSEQSRCEGQKVLELFSGAGNLSIALARQSHALETVENDASAVEAARRNLSRRGLTAKLKAADANEAKPSKDTRIVVLDPPRTGAAQVSKAIAQSAVRRVVMVSCDPATLARDVETLSAGGFAVERVEAFEMFPQTSHVETLVVLSRHALKGQKSA